VTSRVLFTASISILRSWEEFRYVEYDEFVRGSQTTSLLDTLDGNGRTSLSSRSELWTYPDKMLIATIRNTAETAYPFMILLRDDRNLLFQCINRIESSFQHLRNFRKVILISTLKFKPLSRCHHQVVFFFPSFFLGKNIPGQ